MTEATVKNHAAFIWSVADLLRGDYKRSEYGKVVLPLTVIRRLNCVLEPTKVDNAEPVLGSVSREQFLKTSPLDFRRLLDDQDFQEAVKDEYAARVYRRARAETS